MTGLERILAEMEERIDHSCTGIERRVRTEIHAFFRDWLMAEPGLLDFCREQDAEIERNLSASPDELTYNQVPGI